ncbi:MAG: HDIG domain-containing protein [Erysipelotrichaceae bacterium]|nr:HDIG domain-containing protein [Erysipelotrichaceae bacterium]
MNHLVLPDDVSFIIKTLNQHGFDAFVVGGCVRDLLLNKEPKDYDITTSATPAEVEEVFSGMHILETGIKHGTVTLMLNHQPYEITTFRNDGDYADHRHPSSVSFSRKIEDDLSRRDFTINAMAYHPESGLVDLFEGQHDLNSGIIRTVNDPVDRFTEDALRILRAIRFAARYGFMIEEKTAEAMLQCRHYLRDVSSERCVTEFTGILCSGNAGRYLDEYRSVIAEIFPELTVMFDYDQHNRHHNLDLWHHTLKVVDGVSADTATRFAALLHDIGKPEACTGGPDGQHHFIGHQEISVRISDVFLRRLRLSNQLISEILLLIRLHDYPLVSSRTIRKALSECNFETFRKLVDLKRADNHATDPAFHFPDEHFTAILQQAEEILSDNQAVRVSNLDINGYDLLDLGIEPVRIGGILKQLLELVIDDKLPNEKEALLGYVRNSYDK